MVIDGSVVLPRFVCEHSGVARLQMFMNMRAIAAAWQEYKLSTNESLSLSPFEYREVTCRCIRQGDGSNVTHDVPRVRYATNRFIPSFLNISCPKN